MIHNSNLPLCLEEAKLDSLSYKTQTNKQRDAIAEKNSKEAIKY